jgi:hypothetical protein
MTDDGAEIWNEDKTYHSNLKQACLWYLQKSTKGSTGIQDAVNRMSEAEQRIEQMLTKHA